MKDSVPTPSDQQIENLIQRNMPVINRFAARCRNSVLNFEDAQQELIFQVLRKVQKSPDLFTKEVHRQDKTIYKVVRDRHVDLIRFYDRRKDTSWFTRSVTDQGLEYKNKGFSANEPSNNHATMKWVDQTNPEPVFSCSQPLDPEESLEEKMYITELLLRAEHLEEQYPGITQFLQEALDPSEEVEEQYENYQQNHKFAQQPGGSFIPPYTLIKFLGIPESRLRKYHIALSKILGGMGVDRAEEIYERLNFSSN